MAVSVGDGSRHDRSRSSHEDRTLPADPSVLLGAFVGTLLDAVARRTGNSSPDTPLPDLDRRVEVPGKNLNLQQVSATTVASLLVIQGDNPFAALESSSVRGLLCFPSSSSIKNQPRHLRKEDLSDPSRQLGSAAPILSVSVQLEPWG